MILQTARLTIRELDSETDAEFICELLNTDGFLEFIGDRGVRTAADAGDFINTRYRESYRQHGYGLYGVILNETGAALGICGFVRRPELPAPDLGFAFLPEFHELGYASEAAAAMMVFGRRKLGFDTILAITTPTNERSARLLRRLGFAFKCQIESPAGESLNLYSHSVTPVTAG